VTAVDGPGRCTGCSFHVATQGHRDGCSSSTIAPGEVDHEEPCPGFALGRCSTCDCAWVGTLPDDVLLFWKYIDAVKEAERAQRRMSRAHVAACSGPRPTINGATNYGLVALHDECEILAGFPTQGGNNQLNMSAFKLGQLVASGDLPEQLVVDELTAVARMIGLDDYQILGSGDGGTLYSGLRAGMSAPRGTR
jgi:hypothetical protein